jgi:hypothetical protein
MTESIGHAASMQRRLFRPSDRQLVWLTAIGFSAVGYALYLRYLVIEQSTVGLACDAGLRTWLCLTRRIATYLFNHSVFGWLALAFAILNLIRPAFLLFAITLAATGMGLVLYNAALAGLAAGLLILSLARPARARE